MDDDFQSLEAELKRLRPLAPSREASARVEAALRPRPQKFFGGWMSLVLPAAAAIAIVGALSLRRAAPLPPEKFAATAVPLCDACRRHAGASRAPILCG
jgi:hypothetical protein